MRFQPLKIRAPGGIYMIPDYVSETDKTELQEELPAIELWNRLKHMRCRKTPISCARNYKSIDEDEEEEKEEEEEEEEDCLRPKLLKQNPSPSKDLGLPPLQINKWTGKNGDVDSIAAREKVKQTLQHFRDLCKDLHKEAKCRRIDCEAMKIIKQNPEFFVHEKYIGHVPGVEIGDEFCYRMELAIVGLHKPPQAGIDYIKHRGDEICTSVVACGCGDYMNDMKNVELLIYSGHGGNIGRGRKEAEDQKLRAGNLALKNSIGARNPVRVIRGSKGIGEGSKVVSTYIYDGLYVVETYWQEAGRHGKLVFKFRLRRIPGQPRLTESQWRKLGRL